mmetsp:Transcript_2151/g.6502  ORF Transcript_2151/g.6502 Transcript_2151/m.6502 type:complete len:129 (-) Transcript_2151:196-582(-)
MKLCAQSGCPPRPASRRGPRDGRTDDIPKQPHLFDGRLAQLDALTSSREARETAIAGVCGCCKSPTVVDGADDTWLGCGGADCAHSGWFHLGCVGLTDIPDVDEWFCESCAADAAPDDEDDDDDDDEM